MFKNIDKAVELLDNNEKITNKLDLMSVYYEINSAIFFESNPVSVDQNLELLEKIFEHVVKKANKSEREMISPNAFMKVFFKYLYQAPIDLTIDGIVGIKELGEIYPSIIKNTVHNKVLDSFDDLDLRTKSYLSIQYREIGNGILTDVVDSLGYEKGEKIGFEFLDNATLDFYKYLEESINKDKTDDEILNGFSSRIHLYAKDYFIEKIEENKSLLEDTPLFNGLKMLEENDRVTAFVTQIYDITGYIDEAESNDEYIKDCCELLNVDEDTLKKNYFIQGNVSPLKLRKIFKYGRDE